MTACVCRTQADLARRPAETGRRGGLYDTGHLRMLEGDLPTQFIRNRLSLRSVQ